MAQYRAPSTERGPGARDALDSSQAAKAEEEPLLTVLIVEDDPNVASLVRHLLESEGFVSATSVDIEGAWHVLGDGDPPDAAIVDITLAHGDSGWDLVRQIRGHPLYGDLPIVILSGTPEQDVRERVDRLGCTYLGKPFSAAALLDRLQLAMRAAGKAPTLRAVEVVLISGANRIEGTVHVPAELDRFSDAWEAVVRDPRAYVPVTDARLMTVEGGHIVATADLLEVRKDDVLAAAPREALHWPGAPH